MSSVDGIAIVEAERHQPEPGGCTCGFCAWSVEHVAVMVARAVRVDPDDPATIEAAARAAFDHAAAKRGMPPVGDVSWHHIRAYPLADDAASDAFRLARRVLAAVTQETQ